MSRTNFNTAILKGDISIDRMSRHPSAQPAGEVPVGPLALQMGTITGAVDDLVHGYEHLVHSLPNLTSQICNVHADTEQMAKQLEVGDPVLTHVP